MIASLMMGTRSMEIPNNHCAKMNILLWNYRGALNMDFRRRVMEMTVNYFPTIMVITETRVGGEQWRLLTHYLLMVSSLRIL